MLSFLRSSIGLIAPAQAAWPERARYGWITRFSARQREVVAPSRGAYLAALLYLSRAWS